MSLPLLSSSLRSSGLPLSNLSRSPISSGCIDSRQDGLEREVERRYKEHIVQSHMTPDFLKAFDLVIGSEGGYVNDPRDPGGETKFGISKRAYPHLNIPSLTRDDVKPIYYADYWQKLGLDSHPWKIAYPAFDTGVNMGVYAASGMLKSALRSPDPTRALLSARLKHYASLSTFPRFGAGWMDRVVGVALEAGKPPATPV